MYSTKILFEPDNIDNASPATVSRNGMVFMSSSSLTWEPILGAWLQSVPATHAEGLRSRFDGIWEDSMNFVKQQCNPKMDLLDCMYIRQAIDLLVGLLPVNPEEYSKLTDSHLSHYFVFSLMWSIGALLELGDSVKLEEFWRQNNSINAIPCGNSEIIQ